MKRRGKAGYVYGRVDAERQAERLRGLLATVEAAPDAAERSQRACSFRDDATQAIQIIRSVDPRLMPTGAERMERSFGWGEA